MSLIEVHLVRVWQWLFTSWNHLDMTDNTNTNAIHFFHERITSSCNDPGQLTTTTSGLWAPVVVMRMRSVCRWRAAHCALYSSAVVYSVPCWTMPTPHTLGEAAAGQTAPLLLIPILTFFLLLLLMAGLRTQRHAAPRCLSEQIWWRRHWVVILYLNL